jgi:hypothetical protein
MQKPVHGASERALVKREIKTILCLFMVVPFLLASLTGCGNVSSTPSITFTSLTTTPDTTSETTITYRMTSGGVEYFAGLDTDLKFVESRDGLVRILAPRQISSKQMEIYLDRTYKANTFIAGFFDSVPQQPQLVIISPDGQRWASIDKKGETEGWIPSVYPWNISYFNLKTHDGVVHVLTYNWVNAYLTTGEPANEFFAYYLGNASTFKNSGGTLEDFTLKNAQSVLMHDTYFDANNSLTPDAVSAMNLDSSDPVTWGFGFQLVMEQNNSLGYVQIKQLAKLLCGKFTPGKTFGAADYLAAEKEILAGN